MEARCSDDGERCCVLARRWCCGGCYCADVCCGNVVELRWLRNAGAGGKEMRGGPALCFDAIQMRGGCWSRCVAAAAMVA